jgi:hypothetical protein
MGNMAAAELIYIPANPCQTPVMELAESADGFGVERSGSEAEKMGREKRSSVCGGWALSVSLKQIMGSCVRVEGVLFRQIKWGS